MVAVGAATELELVVGPEEVIHRASVIMVSVCVRPGVIEIVVMVWLHG